MATMTPLPSGHVGYSNQPVIVVGYGWSLKSPSAAALLEAVLGGVCEQSGDAEGDLGGAAMAPSAARPGAAVGSRRRGV